MSSSCIGIITEYNPFHNGHAYQLKDAKNHAERIVVIMSGNFTQRGIPAIIDKYERAKIALKNGADMVLEMPVVGSSAGAQEFARCGVGILSAIGIVDTLAFGAEEPDKEKFNYVSDALLDESFEFKKELAAQLKSGVSFPKARAIALEKVSGKTNFTDFLSGSNNILGIEYVKAIKYLGSDISFIPLQRQSEFISSTMVRKAARADRLNELESNLPKDTFDAINTHYTNDSLLFINDFSLFLHEALIKNEDFSYFLDGNDDLSNRTIKYADAFLNTKDFARQVLKSKNITLSHIMRYLTHIMLDITYDDLRILKSFCYAPYVRVLGVRGDSTSLLSDLNKSSKIPVITGYKEANTLLDDKRKLLYNKDLFADDLYRIALTAKSGKIVQNERTRGILKI